MKHIYGVINKYKAEFPVGMECVIRSDGERVLNFVSDQWQAANDSYEISVTRKNFEDIVLCMEVNFGKTSHREFYDYMCADKTKLEPVIELIDAKAYQFENYQHTFMGIYWKEAKLFYTHCGYHNLINCTNIQPLTVGNK